MRAHRLLIVLAVAGCALLAPATSAIAQQPYPPGPAQLTADPSTVVVGNVVVINGTGFGPNDLVSIDATYTSFGAPAQQQRRNTEVLAAVAFSPRSEVIEQVTANAEGAFTVRLEFDRTGTVLITATGAPSGESASVTVRVVVAGLPATGTDRGRLLGEIGFGAGAILLGGLLVGMTVVRRRRNRPAAAAETTADTPINA